MMALDMINDALKRGCSDSFVTKHVFSAEIEPFKQVP